MRSALVVVLLIAGVTCGGLAAGSLDGITVTGWVKHCAGSTGWLNLRGILEAEGARILETSTEDPEELSTLLMETQVFVVPPSASWSDGTDAGAVEAVGASWAAPLREFLARAGRIVAAGEVVLLRGAGLVSAERQDFTGGAYDYGTIAVADSANVLVNQPNAIPGTFGGVQNTYYLTGPDLGTAAAVPATTTTRPTTTTPTTTTPTTRPATTPAVPPATPTGTSTTAARAITVLKEQSTQRAVGVVFPRFGGEVLYLGFSFRDTNDAVRALLVNACYSFGGTTPLAPYISESGVLAGGQSLSLGRVEVSEFTRMLGLSAAGGVEISARLSNLPSVEGVRLPIVAASTGAAESIVLARPLLQNGFWYFTASNALATDGTYAFTAMPLPAIADLELTNLAATGEIRSLPVAVFNDCLSTSTGRLDVTQYRVDVAQKMTGFQVLLSSSGPGRVYVRFGLPIEVADGQVVADIFASTVSDRAALSLAGSFLKAGTYYIAVEAAAIPTAFEVRVVFSE